MKNEVKVQSDAEAAACEPVEIRPAVDVKEYAEGVTLEFEVPGASSKTVEVEVKDQVLTVRAASSLCRNGRPVVFARAFQLSDAVDIEKIEAETKDGVLTIRLPKSEAARVHRIKVN